MKGTELTNYFEKEINYNKGIYNYIKNKLLRFQKTRNLIEKIIIVNQVISFVKTILQENNFPLRGKY